MFNEGSPSIEQEGKPEELQQKEGLDINEVKKKLQILTDELKEYALEAYENNKTDDAEQYKQIAAHISKTLDQGLSKEEKKALRESGLTGETIVEFHEPPTPMVGWEFNKDSDYTVQGWYTFG